MNGSPQPESSRRERLLVLLAYVALARTAAEDACLLACEAAERAVGARGLLAPWPT